MWQARLIDALIRRRRWVIALSALLSLLSLLSLSRLTFSNEIEVWFVKDDPELLRYRAFLERFSADQTAVLGLFADDVFAPPVLRAIDTITRRAGELPQVHRARSLTNARVFRAERDTIAIAPLVHGLPRDAAQARAVRDWALKNPLLVGSLVSRDGRAAAIVVEVADEANNVADKVALVEALKALARTHAPGLTVRQGGTPAFAQALSRYTQQDMFRLTPFGLLLIFAAGFFVFRRVSATLIPLGVVCLAMLWTFGLMGALGVQLTVISSALIGLMVGVGVADAIHVLAEYYRQLMAGCDRDQAVRRSVARLLAPCFFTSVTTCAGLLSLQVSGLRPIREFGLFGAIGVAIAFVISVTLVPAVLHVARPPSPAFIARQRGGPLERLLKRLGRPTFGRSLLLCGLCLPLLALAGWSLTRIEVGSNMIKYFPRDAPLRRDTAALDRALGGAVACEFLVHAPEGGFKDPELLRRIDALQRWLEQQPHVSRVLSIVDWLEEIDRVIRQVPRGELPRSRALAAQYYLLFEGEDDFTQLLQDNYSVGRLTARFRQPEGPGEWSALLARIDARLARLFQPPLSVQTTGFLKLVSQMEDYLLQSQVESFLLAFVVVSLMMLALLRSLRLALLAMIPNLVPILLGVAFMVAAGITLNPGTMMIASIALGLVVDDSVHFLYRLRACAKGEALPLPTAIERAMVEAGRPIIVTSLVLAGTFSIWVGASVVPSMQFGVISAVVILLALLAALVLLPAALTVLRPRI